MKQVWHSSQAKGLLLGVDAQVHIAILLGLKRHRAAWVIAGERPCAHVHSLLVLDEIGAFREARGATRVGASKRLLARVHPHVIDETRRDRERLATTWVQARQWLLACVCPHVNHEGGMRSRNDRAARPGAQRPCIGLLALQMRLGECTSGGC